MKKGRFSKGKIILDFVLSEQLLRRARSAVINRDLGATLGINGQNGRSKRNEKEFGQIETGSVRGESRVLGGGMTNFISKKGLSNLL